MELKLMLEQWVHKSKLKTYLQQILVWKNKG